MNLTLSDVGDRKSNPLPSDVVVSQYEVITVSPSDPSSFFFFLFATKARKSYLAADEASMDDANDRWLGNPASKTEYERWSVTVSYFTENESANSSSRKKRSLCLSN